MIQVNELRLGNFVYVGNEKQKFHSINQYCRQISKVYDFARKNMNGFEK